MEHNYFSMRETQSFKCQTWLAEAIFALKGLYQTVISYQLSETDFCCLFVCLFLAGALNNDHITFVSLETHWEWGGEETRGHFKPESMQ